MSKDYFTEKVVNESLIQELRAEISKLKENIKKLENLNAKYGSSRK